MALPGGEPGNKGEVIYDATVCPQDIAYPTDPGLLNKAREITEGIIDVLHRKQPLGKKPRTYRQTARKVYLKWPRIRTLQKRQSERG